MELADDASATRRNRLQSMLSLLRDGTKPVTAAQLAVALRVSERTIYRYIADLCSQGIAIFGEAGIGYVLKPGPLLSPIVLTEDEAEITLFALRLAERWITGTTAEAIYRSLIKVDGVLAPSIKDVHRFPTILIDDLGGNLPRPTDFGPYLKAIKSQSRLELKVGLKHPKTFIA